DFHVTGVQTCALPIWHRAFGGAGVGIGLAAVQPLFLVGVGDHPHAAARPLVQAGNQRAGGGGDADAGGVVDGAGAEVPGVQVAADGHHFLGQLAPGDFGDDVVGGVFAGLLGADVQAQLHGVAGGEHARQLVGVGIGQGGGGNARHVIGVAHD